MYRSYYHVEIFILLLLYYLGRNLPPDNIFNCSRAKSRLVRMIIHKKVLPVLLRYKLSLPFSCPFHHERDVLWWPNVQLDFLDGQWVCPFCGSSFSSEEVVMDHWDKNHFFFQNEDSVCLAKFCDVFRCEVILAAMESEKNKVSSTTLPSLYQHRRTLIPCDDKKMDALQKKCKIIIRHCLMGILSSVSVKDFQDIEEEVNLAVCSYLTCQKYLDGSLQVVQPVPVLVCVIVGAVLIGGFCLCYYLVYAISQGHQQDIIVHMTTRMLALCFSSTTSLFAMEYLNPEEELFRTMNTIPNERKKVDMFMLEDN